MVLDEHVSNLLEEAARQAIWRGRGDLAIAEEELLSMIDENVTLKKDICSLIVRCAQRELHWSGKGMG